MRQVLFISYYFPPSGGSGVQRTLKFVKYLPEFGWQPTVLTVDPQHAAYPAIDPTLGLEIPATVKVVRTRSWDPYAAYARLLGKRKSDTVSVSFVGESESVWKDRLARWLRANLFVPDARVGWVPYARREASRLHREKPFDAVLTTGPPHSTHLAGRAFARKWGVPWVADMRDPWTGIHYYEQLPMTRLAARRDLRLEASVLNDADAVVVVTQRTTVHMNDRVVRDYVCIPNGFDPADFVERLEPSRSQYTIRHLGTLSRSQNPTALWEALGSLVSQGRQAFRVELVGNVDATIRDNISDLGLDSFVTVLPYVEHDRAVRLMQGASLLLLVVPDVLASKKIVPGKLFEYLASGRPILAVGPPLGDTSAILKECGAGITIDHHDMDGALKLLVDEYESFSRGETSAGADASSFAKYSRPVQAREMADLLDRISATGNVS